jgi:hypothetical protein
MINQLVERKQRSSWVLSPGCLIDRFLDNIEKLSSLVLPLKIDGRLKAAQCAEGTLPASAVPGG